MRLIIYLSALMALTVANGDDGNAILESANLQFTSKMFSEVTNINPGKSVVMSAFSVLKPLAQLALASEGLSHDEILNTIGLPNDNVTKEVFTNLSHDLRSVKGVELKIASRVYIPKAADLNEQFTAVSRDVFGSDFKNVDFSKNIETANEINAWVEEQTNNKIKDLVTPDSLNAATAAVLVNAIYFKGTWKNAFNERATFDRDFHVSKDTTVKVPMMYAKNDYRYGESAELNAKLLELPYQGDESSLLVILPNEVDGLAALEEKLKNSYDLTTKALEEMFPTTVEVFLPKFKIETKINLKDVLINMGITKLFTSEAQLSKLLKGVNDGLSVSDATQRAFIEINEEGTEAAASSAYGIIDRLGTQDEYTFVADKPFYFELRHSNLPLFSGVFTSR